MRGCLVAALLVLLYGCGDHEKGPEAGRAPDAWTVTPAGAGPVRIGMRAADARAAMGRDFRAPEPDGPCLLAPIHSAPGLAYAMIVLGRVVRVDVRDSILATDRGVRVGDPESLVRESYSGRFVVEKHKYTDGNYITIMPEGQDDFLFRIVFETDGDKVTRYRIGLVPYVEWVEGCS